MNFIARNLAWMALSWLAAEEFRAAGGPKEVFVIFPVSNAAEDESRTKQCPFVPHAEDRKKSRLSPIVALYSGRTRTSTVTKRETPDLA